MTIVLWDGARNWARFRSSCDFDQSDGRGPGMSYRLARCENGVRKRAEARDVVPYAFEGLVVIGTRA